MDEKIWQRLLHRQPNTNKYDYGHILVVGGSPDMVGAPVLAARAALRTGAGLVTIASSRDVTDLINRDIEEIMTVSLPSWSEAENVVATLKTFINDRHVSVLVVGPGLPPAADAAIRTLLTRVTLPMVLDARSFWALKGNLAILRTASSANKDIVLTPHVSEYARLLEKDLSGESSGVLPTAQKFAHTYNVTLILKQQPTLVISGEGKVYENTTGNPGLATAGSGDVLSGIVAALVVQKIDCYDAARMAVHLHGIAGDKAAQLKTQPGMIASDIIEALPKAMQSYL